MMKVIATVLVTLLASCSSRDSAPSGQGVCWRSVGYGGGGSDFRVLARGVPNLESCAAQLEGVRMLEGREVIGAYNGHYIFATEQQITSARSLDGARVRVFEAADRLKVQDGLRAMIEHRRSESDSTPTDRGI